MGNTRKLLMNILRQQKRPANHFNIDSYMNVSKLSMPALEPSF